MSYIRTLVVSTFFMLDSVVGGSPDVPEGTGRLKVIVPDLASDRGRVGICLHDASTFTPDNLSKRENAEHRGFARVDITDREAAWTTDPLPYGDYAIVVHHDINDDGTVNFGTILPTEPIGYSNYEHALASYPEFENARIRLAEPLQEIRVEAFMQGRIFRRHLKE